MNKNPSETELIINGNNRIAICCYDYFTTNIAYVDLLKMVPHFSSAIFYYLVYSLWNRIKSDFNTDFRNIGFTNKINHTTGNGPISISIKDLEGQSIHGIR